MLQPGAEKIDLTRIPLFQGVEDGVLGDAGSWVFYFRDGQKIFAQGEPAESMIVILRGEIQVLSQAMSMVTRRQLTLSASRGFFRQVLAGRPMRSLKGRLRFFVSPGPSSEG